jgi:hypothetical protein
LFVSLCVSAFFSTFKAPCTSQASMNPIDTAQEPSAAADIVRFHDTAESPDPLATAEAAPYPPASVTPAVAQLHRSSSFKRGKSRPAVLETSMEHLLDGQVLQQRSKRTLLSCYGACAEGTSVRLERERD